MRILSLSNCPLDPALGSGYVILRYAEGLRARGHQVDLLGPADYEPLHRWRRAIRYRQALGMAWAVLRRRAAYHYDVLEFWGGEGWLALLLLARRGERRALLVCHSNGLEPHAAERMRTSGRRRYQLDLSRLMARGFRAADALVTVAEFDRDYALRCGYAPPERVLAVDNPLPAEYLDLVVPFERPRQLTFCGSWVERKGAGLLAAALPTLLRRLPGWQLTLAGVGSRFRAEDHFASDLLPRVRVIPFAARSRELREIYQSSAIVLVPSLYESFGLVTAEAMACGAAVVATPVGFAAGLRDREEAILLPEGPAVADLCAAVAALADDEPLRLHVARGGYSRVQSLRWEGALDLVESSYRGWLAELRHPARPTETAA